MAEPSKHTGARTAIQASPLTNFVNHHFKVAKTTLRAQLNAPFATFFTCAVIGVALVLPILLSLLLSNLQAVNQHWDGSAQITLVLKQDVTALQGGVLSDTLSKKEHIKSSEFVDKGRALIEFKARFKFADALDFLDENPLPNVILVRPDKSFKTVEEVSTLKEILMRESGVESALLDVVWVQRLQSITQVLQKGLWIIVGMLGLIVTLVLGNTIRLAIENRKDEIVVMKLVGATHAFVRRPFLYMGMLFGFGGGVIAWFLVQGVIVILNQPIRELAHSYQSDFSLPVMDFGSTLILLIISVGLGWFSSWLAVHKHFDEIEPT